MQGLGLVVEAVGFAFVPVAPLAFVPEELPASALAGLLAFAAALAGVQYAGVFAFVVAGPVGVQYVAGPAFAVAIPACLRLVEAAFAVAVPVAYCAAPC